MLRSVSVKTAKLAGSEEAVVIPLFEGTRRLSGAAAKLDRGSVLANALSRGAARADLGHAVVITMSAGKGPSHVVLLGMGAVAKADAENVAHAAGAALKALVSYRVKSAAVLLEDIDAAAAPEFAHAFTKGFGLAQYQFSLRKDKKARPAVRRLAFHMEGSRTAVQAAVKRAVVITEQAITIRDLVNLPADDLTPAVLAQRAKDLCKQNGVACEVFGASKIAELKLDAIMSVARGSREEPRFIVMHHNKRRTNLPVVCLVGKGVTFDSGGISIKPWTGMNEMKGDMGGAAVVIAAVNAAARLKLPIQVVGVVPAVENMPDGQAFRPGDVLKTYSGKTIEVLTTDAEGRLILADALAWTLDNYDPVVTVDFATLTGAVLIALGTRIAGVMGNSQRHIDALIAAGKKSGEPVWQLPLDDHFADSVKGDISDYKNYSGRNGSSITAAALLAEFTGGKPWAHVDIAGTFWNDGSGPSYQSKGATGYGADLTVRFLEAIAGIDG